MPLASPMGAPPAVAPDTAPIPDITGGAGQQPAPSGPTLEERRAGLIQMVRQYQSQLIPMVQADPSFERYQSQINTLLMAYLKQVAAQIGSGQEGGFPRG